jgi:hypothetical protein
MKTQNISLFLILIFLNGCYPEEHMIFNNVPINGSIEKFADELIKSGFAEAQSAEENQIKLSGKFLDKNCEIYVFGTRKSQTPFKVTVNLPEEVRDSLEYRFDKIQKLFSSKYGKGTSKYQQYRNADRFHFNEPNRIRYLSKGDFTRYTTDSGIINMEVGDGFISITYTDKLNSEISKKELGD